MDHKPKNLCRQLDEAKTSVNVSRISPFGSANETARFLILRDAENIRGGRKSLLKVRETRGFIGESKKELRMKPSETERVPAKW